MCLATAWVDIGQRVSKSGNADLYIEEGGSQIDDIRSNLKAEAQFGDYLTRPEAMEWSSTETESAETAFGTALNTKLSEVKDMGEGQKDVEMQGDEVGGSKEKETEEKGTEEKGDDTEEEERPSKRRRSHAEEGAGSGRYSMFY